MTDFDLPGDDLTATAGQWWRRTQVGDTVLRQVRASDAAAVHVVHRDPRVYRLDPAEVHPTLAHSQRFVDPIVEHWELHGFGYWAVMVPGSWWPDGIADTASDTTTDSDTDPASGGETGDGAPGVVAGLGGAQHLELAGEPVLNIYLRLAPEVHRRGLAGRVLSTAIRMAPDVAPGTDLVVRTRPANAAVQRVALRAGFLDDGWDPATPNMRLFRMSHDRLDA